MHRLANFKIVIYCCSFSVLHMHYLNTKFSPCTVLFSSVFRAIVFMRNNWRIGCMQKSEVQLTEYKSFFK